MILHTLATEARERVAKAMAQYSLEELQKNTDKERRKGAFAFEKALQEKDLSIIAEVKKASPSKGIISPNFAYMDVARAYDRYGATAISVLTEPNHFLGADQYLKDIAEVVSVPVLRKDFTVHPYQIYEAACLGADAILLIMAILTDEEVKEFLDIAHSLGLSVLVEAHDAHEVARAIKAGAHIIGVNNRNLKDFTVNPENALHLFDHVPPHVLFVAESGIQSIDTVRTMGQSKIDAILVGEFLMVDPVIEDRLGVMKEACRR